MPIMPRRDRQIILDFQVGFHTLEDVERSFILKVLEYFEGDRQSTADCLGIGRSTLLRKLKRYRQEDYLLKDLYIRRKENLNGTFNKKL